MPNHTTRCLTLVLALALMAGCKTGPVVTPGAEGTVSAERGGARVAVAGHVFALRTLDGKSLDTLDLQVGDQVFHTKDGKLSLPEAALAAIRARGAFLVRAPGYVPRKVAFDGQGEVALVPIGATLASATLAAAGGHLAAGNGAVALDLPVGMLAQPAAVTVSPYQVPAGDLDAAGMGRERAAVIAAVGQPDRGCDHPLPCPPPTASLGLLIDVGGQVQDGAITVGYNLAALAANNPAAVDRLRATFAAIDATGDPAWRKVLEQRYGLTLVGDRLSFPVRVGDAAFNDGVARIEVDGVGVLGVCLEVTLVSRAGGPATGATPTPPANGGVLHDRLILGNLGNLITNDGASLITNDGGSLIGQDGAGLITNDGAGFVNRVNGIVAQGGGNVLTDNGNLLLANAGNGLITNDGGSLISNDGGGLISLNAGGALVGKVLDPGVDTGGTGKYAVLQVGRGAVPAPAGGNAVVAQDGAGAQVGPGTTTDTQGNYRLDHLPVSWNGLIVKAVVGTDVLRTLAPAPGKLTIQADLTAATSGMAAVVLDGQAASPGQTLGIPRGAYDADVQTLTGLLTPADARYCVSNPVPAVAAYVRALFARGGVSMRLNLPSTPAVPVPAASPYGLGTGTNTSPGSELQIHGLGLPTNMVGLRVTIGGLSAAISRSAGPNDFFVAVPASTPVGPSTIQVYFQASGLPIVGSLPVIGGVTGLLPEVLLLDVPITVDPPAAANSGVTLQVGVGNPGLGTTLPFTGSNVPPAGQLAVTIGGVPQAVIGSTATSLQVQVSTSTPLGPQPLVVTWNDPTGGAHQVLIDTVTVGP